MIIQSLGETEQLVAIPVDEYAELIECKTQLNAVYGYLTFCHSDSLKYTGRMAKEIDADVLKTVSGYKENENYFEYLKRSFKGGNK